MKRSDLTQWLLGEARTVLADSAAVSAITTTTEADPHVDIADPDVDHEYPFVGVRTLSSDPLSAGIGNGQAAVTDVTRTNGTVTQITYQRETRITYEIIPVTDNDPKQRDDLADDIYDHFSLRQRTDGTPDDARIETLGEAVPSDRVEDFVRAEGVRCTLLYTTDIVDSDPDVTETVEVDLNTEDSSGTSADAISDTVS